MSRAILPAAAVLVACTSEASTLDRAGPRAARIAQLTWTITAIGAAVYRMAAPMSARTPTYSTASGSRASPVRSTWCGLGAWSVHLVAGYALITAGCPARGPGADALLAAAFVALTVALAAAAAAALAAALRVARSDTGWARFVGVAGALLDGLALATIVLGGTQVLALPPCA